MKKTRDTRQNTNGTTGFSPAAAEPTGPVVIIRPQLISDTTPIGYNTVIEIGRINNLLFQDAGEHLQQH